LPHLSPATDRHTMLQLKAGRRFLGRQKMPSNVLPFKLLRLKQLTKRCQIERIFAHEGDYRSLEASSAESRPIHAHLLVIERRAGRILTVPRTSRRRTVCSPGFSRSGLIPKEFISRKP